MPKKTGSSRRCDASTPTCAIVGDLGWRPGRPGSVEAQPRPWHRPNERPPAAGQGRGDPAVVGPLGEADPPARRLMTGSRAKTAQGNRNGGTNGPDPDYSHSYPPLRGRVRLSPVGIWRRDRYWWYSADHTRHLFVARARGIVIFRNYVADTPDRVVSAEPGYSSGRVRSAMVDGGRGCPDRSARSAARRDTQARMNAVLQIRSAPSTSQRYPEQKNCCWIAPRRRGDLLSLGHRPPHRTARERTGTCWS